MTFYNWKKKSKWLNLLIGLDQLGNTIFRILPWPFTWPGSGNPDKTISFTLGRLQLANKGKIPWKYPVAKIIAGACDAVGKNHCIKAFKNGT